jgi:hypothetical protein
MLVLVAIIVLVLLAILAVGSLVTALALLVKRHDRRKNVPSTAETAVGAGSSSKIGVCASCGETRIIIKPEGGFCASCYSTLLTKKLQ